MNDFLYNKRKELGYTLEEVGDMVGVGKSTVRKWEKGMIENMGRDKIVALSKALNISPIEILGLEEELKSDIVVLYDQLEQPRQEKVYSFAEHQLEEQNKVVSIEEYKNIRLQSILSAGTGIVDLDPDYAEEFQYKGYVPEHDLAFRVSGNSMEPIFKDSEIIFVEKTTDIRNGQIIAVQINEEAYIKKAYLEDDQLRLVSLNKEYKDIIADNNDDIRIVGRVIL